MRYNGISMKRVFRILFRTATLISQVLCLAALAIWVRSMWVCDRVRWESYSADRYYRDVVGAMTCRGGVRLITSHYAGLTYSDKEPGHFHYSSDGLCARIIVCLPMGARRVFTPG